MKMNEEQKSARKGLGLVGLFAALLVVSMAGVAQAQPAAQTWNLTDESHPAPQADDETTHTNGDEYMNKSGFYGTQKNPLFVDGETMWWYATNTALCDVPFGEDDWTVYVTLDSTGITWGDLYATVCSVQSDGTIRKELASGSVFDSAAAGVRSRTITCGDNTTTNQTIPGGDVLAVKLWYDKKSGVIYPWPSLRYNSATYNSRLVSPSTDPGYPVPELPTIVLMSVGLLALLGYVGWRRKKKE